MATTVFPYLSVDQPNQLSLFSFIQDYKTYLDFVLAMENKKEPQVITRLHTL